MVFRVGSQLWLSYFEPATMRWEGAFQVNYVSNASERPTAVQYGTVLQVAYKPAGSNSVQYVYFDPAIFDWVGPLPADGTAATSSPSMTVHNGTELQIGYQVGSGVNLRHVYFEAGWHGPGEVLGTSGQVSEPSLTTDYQ